MVIVGGGGGMVSGDCGFVGVVGGGIVVIGLDG